MIPSHAFHSRWWGAPVGILTDSSQLHSPNLAEELSGLAWCELRLPLDAEAPRDRIFELGFILADVQVPFRLDMARAVESMRFSASTESRVKVETASESSFEVRGQSVATFSKERFRLLPGCDADRLRQRYVLWANQLIQDAPNWALQLTMDGKVQGWFLSSCRGRTVELTLAMLSSEATISGHQLYARAIQTYCDMGAKRGAASFSVSNTAVMNIYSSFGARFTGPQGCWLYWSRSRGHSPPDGERA